MSNGLATVDPLSDHAPWSSKGAAGDALQRVTHGAPFIAVWINEDGGPSWSKANLDWKTLAQISAVIDEMKRNAVAGLLVDVIEGL